jgi:hypothetical protein
MENKNIINGNCWVAYCDVLGFKRKIRKFEEGAGEGRLNIFVDNYYNKIIEELKRQNSYHPKEVFSTWFSDTFLFFTYDDSINSFGCLRGTFDVFCWMIISRGWPLRGAIGFGQLYVDITNNIFLGSSIINAYEYAERQNWIGSIVTQEASERLRELDVDLSQWNTSFKEYSVPFHENGEKILPEKLFVSKIHFNHPEIIKSVEQMQQQASNEKDKIKYKNTLEFFKKYP